MKSLLVNPLVLAVSLALAWTILGAAGVRISPLEPLCAGIICAAAGVLGLLPLLRSARRDLTSVFQMALVGTVIHLLSASALAGGIIALHLVQPHLSFVLWLLAGYWISLITLMMQLRRMILTHVGLAGTQ